MPSEHNLDFTDEIYCVFICVLTSVRSSSGGCSVLLSNITNPFLSCVNKPTFCLLNTSNFPFLFFFSHRSSVFDPRGHGLSSMPVLKDSRPLSDRRFQSAAVQKVRYAPCIVTVSHTTARVIAGQALDFIGMHLLSRHHSKTGQL